MHLSFGKAKPIVCDAVRSDASVVFRSSPFFGVAQYRERWFLRDGRHRAFRCLKAGISHLSAVIVRAQTVEQLGAVHPWFFPEEVLFSGAPPGAIDFINDALVIEYNRASLSKMLRNLVEEAYNLRGTNL